MCVLKSGPSQVHTLCGAVSPQHHGVGSGPASAVEDPRSAAACGTRDERFDESAEAAEPEVDAFGARSGLEQSIHRGKLDANSYISWVRSQPMKNGIR